MGARIYLTIDDSPSATTGELTGFLKRNGIPALLFCRGDLLEADPGPVIRAIRQGFSIGNHAYSHKPAGELGVSAVLDEIERTEELIEAAYVEAGARRKGYYFRFPYIDRGDGDRLERRFDKVTKAVEQEKETGLHADPQGRLNVLLIQDYLKGAGFSQPFPGVNHPLYGHREVRDAADCFFTFSSCDWMLTQRHKGKWPCKGVNDLMKRMDDDPWLLRDGNTGIALFHDQAEIFDETVRLIGYTKSREIKFMNYR